MVKRLHHNSAHSGKKSWICILKYSKFVSFFPPAYLTKSNSQKWLWGCLLIFCLCSWLFNHKQLCFLLYFGPNCREQMFVVSEFPPVTLCVSSLFSDVVRAGFIQYIWCHRGGPRLWRPVEAARQCGVDNKVYGHSEELWYLLSALGLGNQTPFYRPNPSSHPSSCSHTAVCVHCPGALLYVCVRQGGREINVCVCVCVKSIHVVSYVLSYSLSAWVRVQMTHPGWQMCEKQFN